MANGHWPRHSVQRFMFLQYDYAVEIYLKLINSRYDIWIRTHFCNVGIRTYVPICIFL